MAHRYAAAGVAAVVCVAAIAGSVIVSLQMSDDADRNLAYLAFSLVTVSFPVEAWKQPHVPDSGAAAIPLVVEPGF